ncbi:class I SAM-dependent methyltransferase [Rhodopirellula sallentina]|uniref:Methyltransferase type 11 n=1 Tax=Rhodopirellula sallentina SM41 TaxID=1263870 RepID=M5U8E8_9BACT|nr:methyltransferase domain-containing protein [Rhodopirellula sallentina]EMI57737.1 Methyltransferase type 11 [Rhodopirellula sallentina SM41]
MDSRQHDSLTIEQFTRQALPFARLPGHSTSMDVLVEMASPNVSMEMLDVACGPGLVACHFASKVRHVTGIDLTPEMLRQARDLQTTRGIENAEWIEGYADRLPFDEASFDLVVTRYSMHHFQNPDAVLREMVRVCKPGGRVLVADVSLPQEHVEHYDELERYRDPSHVHALSRGEFADALVSSGLQSLRFAEYKVDLAVEEQLAASVPVKGGADRIRAILRDDVERNQCGVAAYYDGEVLRYAIPIVVGVGTVADPSGQ